MVLLLGGVATVSVVAGENVAQRVDHSGLDCYGVADAALCGVGLVCEELAGLCPGDGAGDHATRDAHGLACAVSCDGEALVAPVFGDGVGCAASAGERGADVCAATRHDVFPCVV